MDVLDASGHGSIPTIPPHASTCWTRQDMVVWPLDSSPMPTIPPHTSACWTVETWSFCGGQINVLTLSLYKQRSNPPPSPPPPLPLTNSRAFAPQVGTDWATLVNQHRADNALPMMNMPSSNSLFGNGRAADSPTLNSPRDQPGHSLNLHPRDMAQTLAYTNHDDRSGSGTFALTCFAFPSSSPHFL